MPEGKSAFADPWVQIFGLAAILSGALALRAPASGKAAPADPTAMQRPVQQPAAPAAAAKNKSRKPGQWIVDKAMGPDADSADLAQVLDDAADGDVVLIKPGVYDGPFVVSKSLQLVGAGAKSDVRLVSDGTVALQVSAGKVFAKNLSIAGAAGAGSAALFVARAAEASLQDCTLAAAGPAARVSGGWLAASRTDFSGGAGISLEAGGKARLESGSLAGADAGALLKGDGLSIELSGVRFHDVGRAVNVEGRSRAAIDNGDFNLTASGGGVFAFGGADVTLKQSRFELNHASQVALFAQEATVAASNLKVHGSKGAAVIARKSATVNLDDSQISDSEWAALVVEEGSRVRAVKVKIEDNLDCALNIGEATVLLDNVVAARNRCGAAFYGAGKLDAKKSAFTDNKLGTIVVKPGLEQNVTVTGVGDQGLPPPQAVAAPPPAAQKQAAAYFTGGHLKGDPFGEAQAWMRRIGH